MAAAMSGADGPLARRPDPASRQEADPTARLIRHGKWADLNCAQIERAALPVLACAARPTDSACDPARDRCAAGFSVALCPLWEPQSGRHPQHQKQIPDLFLHQRTFALVERTPRLLRRNGRELLVVVPGRLALLGLLHLEQVHRMDLAPVDAHVALAHEPVFG